MSVPKRAAFEPDVLPAWPSAEWEDWERKIVAAFREKCLRDGPDFWRTRAIHPGDAALIAAARIVWNGEYGEPEAGPAPRAWRWDSGRREYWLLELPPGMEHATVRAMIRQTNGR